jgi:hypothetical protein
MKILLPIHPIMQFSATLLGLYILHQGIRRFRSLHLNQEAVFNWKLHVLLGEITLGAWLVGFLGGMTTVYLFWSALFITGTHAKIAFVMVPLIIFGLASGLYMDHKKRARKVLPLIHGLSNLTVLVLACVQVVTGYGVYQKYVAGL